MIRLNVFFIALFCFGCIACNDAGTGKKFEFYYYPARNIYYDVTNTQFIYSINGGKTWEIFKKELGKDPATIGSREVIYSDSQQPWTHNAADIKQYNGKLFGVADEDTTAQLQTEAVSDKKIIKKAKPVADESKKEKKPGFFKRLFGKKN